MELFAMRLYFRKLVIILMLIVILLFFVLFYWRFNNSGSTELLVAWGVKDDVFEGDCILQVINPKRQESSQIHVGDTCNYEVTNIQGQPRLVEVQREPGAMVVYSITSDGDLIVDKTLLLNGVKVVSYNGLDFQVGNDGTIYFPGILSNAEGVMKDREQILRIDPTGEIMPLAANEDGMAAYPFVSPGDSHLIYLIHDGIKSSAECISVCGYYYHLLDIETNSDVNLASLVNHLGANPAFSHCYAQWSPNGRFLAFNIGCESESPQYIVIFNVEDNEIVTVIKPIESDSVNTVDWLSNDELVYGQWVHVEGYEYPFYHYFVYSISSDIFAEFLNLTLTNSDGYINLGPIDWASGGQYIAGATTSSDGIIVVDTSLERQNVNYISANTLSRDPLWSPSGNWIAYKSSPDSDTFFENGFFSVKIADRAGQMLLDTDVVNIQGGLGYAWLRP